MNETYLTAVGRLITTPERWRFADGSCKVSFRVASNQRRFDRATNGWIDGDTLYLTVVCWRDLAAHVHASFQTGDPIIVHGRLITREWEKDGKRRSIVELDASAVGPNLAGCTATVIRTRRAASTGELGADTDSTDTDSTDTGAGTGSDVDTERTGDSSSIAETTAAARDSVVDPWQEFSAADGARGRREPEDGHPDDWPDDASAVVAGASVEAAVGS